MERLSNISEIAEYLGVKVNTIYAWVHTQQIPFYKVGRFVKFKKQDINIWLEERKINERST